MKFVVQMLLNRAKEPSTFAGLGGVLAAVGISLPPEATTSIITIVGGVAALASMFMKERAEKTN
tara:strand:- start:4552 stop:4743 length:192 start_codon:yes stop_codon:yes gene_type:complete